MTKTDLNRLFNYLNVAFCTVVTGTIPQWHGVTVST